MKVGVLTGGGDCPGLNAVIRAVSRRVLDRGDRVVGVLHGWRGLLEGQTVELGERDISGILPRGGTILRTSRTNPLPRRRRWSEFWPASQLDALVAIGGEDTLGVAARLHAEHGCHIVGVPKTIDNDISGTDVTFGFDTAVAIATEAIDRLHSTAESHDRVMVCEVMGRHTGWIALTPGMAGGADMILIPERPLTVERCREFIRRRHGAARTSRSSSSARVGSSIRGGETRRWRAPRRTRSATSGWAASASRSPTRSRRAPGSRPA